MSIAELYPRVTGAIERARERVEAGDDVGARHAYHEVFMIEADIAVEIPGSTNQGAIARCGAVSAALKADEPVFARDLALQYLDEPDLMPKARKELRALLKKADSVAVRPRVSPRAAAGRPTAALSGENANRKVSERG